MTVLSVDGLNFTFPAGWRVSKYDEWAFYRNQFGRAKSGLKAVDLLAAQGPEAWLIEVKDYRRAVRTKVISIDEEVAAKVVDTLACLFPAKVNANVSEEREFAAEILGKRKIRVVLHLEQPIKHSRLFPRAIDPASVLLKLRVRLHAIDPHPLVVERLNMRGLGWAVA
ncbi:hypothetical protein [Pseudoxanthomonas sp. Soil82]|uniref:hypothetical protein n=1 Tax=Pseudoxanthomonas sp. Soil82 TaxID=3157341 RepID=UPI00338D9AFB